MALHRKHMIIKRKQTTIKLQCYPYQKLFILIAVLSFCFIKSDPGEANQVTSLIPSPPGYELILNMNELIMLNYAIHNGLDKYGGSIKFEMTAAKRSSGTFWKMTIKNPKLPDVLLYWVSANSLEIIKTMNPDDLSPDNKMTLKIIKSLAEKIEVAKKNPVLDEIKLSGTIIEKNNTLFIKGKNYQYPVTGELTNNIRLMINKQVLMNGVVKMNDLIEATHIILKKKNTLELFVMSQCPVAKKAEESLIHFMDALPNDQKPEISIRYIFYFKDNRFISMHGESELVENLVQMVIRDGFPDYFHPYLLKRAADSETPWKDLAKEVGLPDATLQSIENSIITQREKLIVAEYNYAVQTYKITDGSPTFVWESDIIPAIQKIELFNSLKFTTTEMCSK